LKKSVKNKIVTNNQRDILQFGHKSVQLLVIFCCSLDTLNHKSVETSSLLAQRLGLENFDIFCKSEFKPSLAVMDYDVFTGIKLER
jgi:hypothetical protein